MSRKAANGSGAFEGCPSLLEQVVSQPLLPHLTAEERLACFRTCHGMSALVAGHAPGTKLCLNLQPPRTHQSSDKDAPSPCTHALAAQQLAAQSSNLALTLQGRLLSPAQCIWPCITSLCLDRLWLSAADLSAGGQLQLHRLVHLHTLRLYLCQTPEHISSSSSGGGSGGGSSGGGGSGIGGGSSTCHGGSDGGGSSSGCSDSQLPSPAQYSSPAQQPSPAAACPKSTTIRSLQVTGCCNLLSSVLALLDMGQLQTLITNEEVDAGCLEQMTALQEVHLGYSYPDGPSDNTIQRLLDHPNPLRVNLCGGLGLQGNYSDRTCRWASLHIRCASVHLLAALTLASIPRLTVENGLSEWKGYPAGVDPADTEARDQAMDALVLAAVRNVDSCPHVVFEPSLKVCLAEGFTPQQVVFSLGLCDTARPQQSAPLIAMAMRHLSRQQNTALMVDTDVTSSFDVLATLATAPETVTTMGFELETQYQEEDLGQGVVTYLPDHVSHVLLYGPGLGEAV